MSERETATNQELARDQNFFDQPPFAELLESAHQQTDILLADLRRGLIYYARVYYARACNSQGYNGRITERDLQSLSTCKGSRPETNQRQLGRLPRVIWGIGQKFDPLALQYIATQWDYGQYCHDGEPKKNINFFVPPKTCEIWSREKWETDKTIEDIKRGKI